MERPPPGLCHAVHVGGLQSQVSARDGGADRWSLLGLGEASAETRALKGRVRSGSAEAGSNGSAEQEERNWKSVNFILEILLG